MSSDPYSIPYNDEFERKREKLVSIIPVNFLIETI